jgi:Delta7-sterol 5-desaturase
MDLVLKICDDFVFDKFWATLVPLSAFPKAYGTFHAMNSSFIGPVVHSASKWSQIIAHLPHPPLSNDDFTSFYSASRPMAQVSAWPRDYLPRQILSLSVITLVGIHILYFLFAGLSYKFIFNHDMMRHPRFLKNQVWLEIKTSLWSFPGMTLLTLPWFEAEVLGYSKLYDGLDTYGYFYLFASVPL